MSQFAVAERFVRDGRCLIAVQGELDLFTAPELRARINEAVDEGTRQLVIDLSETAFLDSTGLGVLLGALKRIRSCQGQLVIIDSDENLLRTFRVAGIDQILTIVASEEEALASLAASP